MSIFKGAGRARTKSKPATEKQKAFIEELLGYLPAKPLSISEASELIDELLESREDCLDDGYCDWD